MSNDTNRPRRIDDAHIVRVISRLTDRDRRIALDCYEHRVLTTEQLRRLHFSGERTGRDRLNVLYALRVLDRFRPSWQHGEGSPPFHWILDEAGARIVAAELRLERTELRWRRAVAIRIASSTQLAHQIEVNDFFTSLAEQARDVGAALTEWYGERTTQQLLGGDVIPDGYGVLCLPRRPPAHLLLELDRGTETHDRLREKARGYAKALPTSQLRDAQPTILLAVPDASRAAWAERNLNGAIVPIVPVVWTSAHFGSTLMTVVQATNAPNKAP